MAKRKPIKKLFKLITAKRNYLADKFGDSANYILVALVLESFISKRYDWRTMALGIILYLILIMGGYILKK
jgi:hypothetical protein